MLAIHVLGTQNVQECKQTTFHCYISQMINKAIIIYDNEMFKKSTHTMQKLVKRFTATVVSIHTGLLATHQKSIE